MSLAEKLEQRGFKKGHTEGHAQGRTQGQREIAHNMLQQKADPLFVAKVTGLSLDDIQKLNLGNDH